MTQRAAQPTDSSSPPATGSAPEGTDRPVSVSYGSFWRRWFAFSGPAFMVSVGYMDPGNWATDLEGGARFGYELLWVLLASNLIAVLLQTLAARLGIVSGHDLAQACQATYSKPLNLVLWLLCEIAIAACDLAEVIGTVIGLNLLFGLPPLIGLFLTALDTFLFLAIQRLGIRKLEAFILVLIATVGACFLIEIILVQPVWAEVAKGLVPTLSSAAPFLFSSDDALYIAIGILGATVMPHNLYLHSALVQTRKIEPTPRGKQQACRFNLIDSVVALNLAFLVNGAILILAAAAFYQTSAPAEQLQNIQLEDAHRLLHSVLGSNVAPMAFAIALLAAGQSSTITGTLAGQIVMEGFLNLRLTPWVRRLVTRMAAIVPAFLAIWYAGPHSMTRLLVLSQVILSLQLPFAIVPLLQFTSDRERMGGFTTGRPWRVLGWIAVWIVIALNVRLVWVQCADWFGAAGDQAIWLQVTLIPLAASLGLLLVWLVIAPWVVPRVPRTCESDASMAKETAIQVTKELTQPVYRKIGVALDRFPTDHATLRHAVAMAKTHQARLVLIHVVEGVGGTVLGSDASDDERRGDESYLHELQQALSLKGIDVHLELRFGTPSVQIIAVARERELDLLILGSHGHGRIADWIFGETASQVRHRVTVPVLIVREAAQSPLRIEDDSSGSAET